MVKPKTSDENSSTLRDGRKMRVTALLGLAETLSAGCSQGVLAARARPLA